MTRNRQKLTITALVSLIIAVFIVSLLAFYFITVYIPQQDEQKKLEAQEDKRVNMLRSCLKDADNKFSTLLKDTTNDKGAFDALAKSHDEDRGICYSLYGK